MTILPLTPSHRCRHCGRTIYLLRAHLPRCLALGRPKG